MSTAKNPDGTTDTTGPTDPSHTSNPTDTSGPTDVTGPTDTVVRAAGCVLWRRSLSGGELEVCLVHRPKYDDWSHPKGKLKRGEEPLAGALREVEEETGHRAAPGARLPTMEYEAKRPSQAGPLLGGRGRLRHVHAEPRGRPSPLARAAGRPRPADPAEGPHARGRPPGRPPPGITEAEDRAAQRRRIG